MYFRKRPRILICSFNPFRTKPQNAKGTPTEKTLFFCNLSSRARSGPCRRQLDPLRARRRPGRVSIRRVFPFWSFSSVSLYSIFMNCMSPGTSRQISAAGLLPLFVSFFFTFQEERDKRNKEEKKERKKERKK